MTTSEAQAAGAAAPQPQRALTATMAAVLVPGAGHLLVGPALLGAVLLALTAAGVAVGVLHLAKGLAIFESPLGAFFYRVILRAVVVFWAFGVIDAYLRAVAPADRGAARTRLGAFLNILLPGTGYLLARAWLRVVTGLALVAVIIYFARLGRMAYLDVIFVGMQLVMGALAYLQLNLLAEREREKERTERAARREPLREPRRVDVPAAQIVCIVVALAAAGLGGFVVYRSLPVNVLRELTRSDLQIKPGPSGIQFAIPRLGLSLKAVGPGWSVLDGQGRFLFDAEREAGGRLMLGVQQIYPFERRDRMQHRLLRSLESQGLSLQRTLEIGRASCRERVFITV